jgi:histidinol phosphatase-like enzyme
MILQARKDVPVKLGYSVLICDKLSDIQAGAVAGIRISCPFAYGRPIAQSGLDRNLVETMREATTYLQRSVA